MRLRILPLASSLAWLLAASPSQALEPWAGATLDYREVFYSYRRPNNTTASDHFDTYGASAVLDVKYLRINAGYACKLGRYVTFADGQEQAVEGHSICFISGTLLGKYPFDLGRGVSLWPALGLQYDLNTRFEYHGPEERAVNTSPNDLYLSTGLGSDILLAKRVALTGSLLAAYNLTPSLGSSQFQDPSGLAFRLSLGLILRL